MKFLSEIKMRNDLESTNKSAYLSWRRKLEGKTFFIAGMCDNAFAIVEQLGAYDFEYISGKPETLFEEVSERQVTA